MTGLKTTYLQARISGLLIEARLCLVSRVPACNFNSLNEAREAKAKLYVALAFARQLPNVPKYRAERAHIVAAIEAIGNV